MTSTVVDQSNNGDNQSVWFHSNCPSWIESLLFKILRCGPIPKHVAVIMDGNRRYAKRKKLDQQSGYLQGFETITKTIQWCKQLGLREVTIFAFSIENFNRDPEEVRLLMNLTMEKFQQLKQESDRLKREQICIRFFGNLEFLPEPLQRLIGEIMLMTRHHRQSYLNVCLAYTARHELASAVDRLCSASEATDLREQEITDQLVSSCLDTRHCPEPELLIRTSGEIRLSDFLLWQSVHSELQFTSVLWPECRVYDFFKIILAYQFKAKMMKGGNQELTRSSNETHSSRLLNSDHKFMSNGYHHQTEFDRSSGEQSSESSCEESTRDSSSAGSDTASDDTASSIDSAIEYLDQMQIERLQRMKFGQCKQRPPPISESDRLKNRSSIN